MSGTAEQATSPTLVLEVDAWTGSAVETLRFGEQTINTVATDSPAHTTYKGLIVDAGQLSRSVSILGQLSESRGGATLNNADGSLDALYNYGWGRAYRFKELSSKGALVSEAPIVASGVCLGLDSSAPFTEIRLRFRDAMEKLKTPLLTERYLGTTTDGTVHTAEGDITQKDKLKPLILGSRANVTPVQVDRFNLVYQVSYKAVSLIRVYDRAVLLTSTTDYADLAALLSATIAAGSYGTCLALGLFKLGDSPVGLITADVEVGTTATRSAARVAQQIIDILNDDGAGIEVDQDSFDDLHTFNPAQVEIYVDSNTNANELLVSVLGWIRAGVDPGADGVLRVFPTAVTAGTAERTFTIRDMIESNFAFVVNPQDEGGSTPAWSFVVKYGGVQTVQEGSELDGTAADSDRIVLVAEATQSATAQDADVLDVYPNAVEITIETGIRLQADAEAVAASYLTFYKVRRDRNSFTVPASIGRKDLGSLQAIQMSRFGYTAGKNCVVVGRIDNFKARRVTLQLLG
jgi:hypothetical protein